MKSSLIPFVCVLLTAWCSAASQSRYEDQPMGLTATGAAVIRHYEAKARATPSVSPENCACEPVSAS